MGPAGWDVGRCGARNQVTRTDRRRTVGGVTGQNGQTESGDQDAQRDINTARSLAWTVLEKLAYVEAGQRSPDVVLAGGHTIDRRMMLHGQYARLLLRQMNADLARLHTAAAGCRRQYTEATTLRHPDPHEQALLMGAELADIAALIVGTSGMQPRRRPRRPRGRHGRGCPLAQPPRRRAAHRATAGPLAPSASPDQGHRHPAKPAPMKDIQPRYSPTTPRRRTVDPVEPMEDLKRGSDQGVMSHDAHQVRIRTRAGIVSGVCSCRSRPLTKARRTE